MMMPLEKLLDLLCVEPKREYRQTARYGRSCGEGLKNDLVFYIFGVCGCLVAGFFHEPTNRRTFLP